MASGIVYYLNHNLNEIITEKVNSKFNNSSISEYYNLSFNKIKINVLRGTLNIYNVKLSHKTDYNKKFFQKYGNVDCQINKLILKGVDVYTFIKTDSLNVDKIIIKDPIININKGDSAFKPFNFIEKKNDSTKIPFHLNNLSLVNAYLNYSENDNNIIVTDLSISSNNITICTNISASSLTVNIKEFGQTSKTYENINNVSFKNLNINIKDLNIIATDTSSNYTYSNFNIKIKSPKFHTKDSLYTVKTNNIEIDYKNKNIEINNILFKPNFSKLRFAKKFKYQTERYYFDIKEVKFYNFNFAKFIIKPHIYADSMTVKSVISDIYRDKTYPLNKNNFPLYPAQIIKRLPIPINVDIIKVNNANIKYSEKVSAKKTGKVDLSHLNIIINNVCNTNSKKALKINAEGKIRNKIPFRIDVNFNYNKPSFSYSGTVYKSNLKNANKIISSFENIEIKKGTIKKLTFKGYANNTISKGEMLFLYNNVSIKFLNQDDKTYTKIKNKFTAFIANTVIHKNNPSVGKTLARTVNFKYTRDKNKGFINLIWKSLFNGIIETIIPTKENKNKYKADLKKQSKQHARK